jgi:phosphoribosyl 1,2-cyclic phosphate phosphodiesterase
MIKYLLSVFPRFRYNPPMKITVLGSGTSHGIPVIGCNCSVCKSADWKDRRTRTSLWIREGKTSILIDTATEFRLQAVREGLEHLDAVFLTHAHADHIHGLDDLRPLSWKGHIPVYGKEDTLEEIRSRFSYIFKKTQIGGGKPKILLRRMEEKPVRVGGLTVVPLPVFHGDMRIQGYKIGTFAYITDCSMVPDETYELLKGVEYLIIGALRETPHATHFSIAQAIEAAERISPKRVYLTHLSHEVGNSRVEEMTPLWAGPAWDGLTLEL